MGEVICTAMPDCQYTGGYTGQHSGLGFVFYISCTEVSDDTFLEVYARFYRAVDRRAGCWPGLDATTGRTVWMIGLRQADDVRTLLTIIADLRGHDPSGTL